MKTKISPRLMTRALPLAAVAAVCLSFANGPGTTSKGTVTSQNLTVVVDNGFKPALLNVKAGKPVQITFVTKHKSCASVVVFSDFKAKVALKDGTKTVFRFIPKKAGTYSFACGMGMMKGTIVAK